MKRIVYTSLLIASSPLFAYELQGKVVNISDGDTITVLDSDNRQQRIRLYGIDTPEKKQPFGGKASDMLSALIKGKAVTADCTTPDRYQRHVCTVFVDGTDINAEMVKQGGAWVYRQYYTGDAYYKLEDAAKAEKRGLWQTSEYHATPPWEWRKNNQNQVSKKETASPPPVDCRLKANYRARKACEDEQGIIQQPIFPSTREAPEQETIPKMATRSYTTPKDTYTPYTPPTSYSTGGACPPGSTWVSPHTRKGRPVRGHCRRVR